MRRLLLAVVALVVAALTACAPAPVPPVTPPPTAEPPSIAGDWVISRTVVSSDDDRVVVGTTEVRYLVLGDAACDDGVCRGPIASSDTDGVFVPGSADALVATTGEYTWDGRFLDYGFDCRTGFDCLAADGTVALATAYAGTYTFRFSADGDGFAGTVALRLAPRVDEGDLEAAGCGPGERSIEYDATLERH